MNDPEDLATPEWLLETWQRVHQSLNLDQQAKFLARPQIVKIAQFTKLEVEEAVIRHPKLTDILLEIITAQRIKLGLDPLPGSPGVLAPGLSGTAGTRAGYASGLAHNPGNLEQPIGERCSNCGAFIPSGAVHDC